MLTIQDLEELAAQIAGETSDRRQKLLRMIRAYCKIINAREPDKFSRRACHFGDEAGNCDGSYPPKQVYSDRSGPLGITIISFSSEDVPNSGGFYHDYHTVSTDSGLYVSPKGELFGGSMTGTGSFGQFPAHPGDCNVDCCIEWSDLDPEEVPLDLLEKAEKELRDIAFPLIADRDKLKAGITG
jgi:hypothetical protein